MKRSKLSFSGIVAIALCAACLLGLVCCAAKAPGAATETAPTEPAKVTETENIKMDAFLVDDTYVDSDSAELKMVYLFLTVSAKEQNMKVDSKYTKLKIGSNSYDSDFYKGTCDYAPNYYYSSFIEDLYVGSDIKLALTFKVPQGDLVAGKDVTLEDSDLPVAKLRFTTDDLVTCSGIVEVGKAADPAGAEAEIEKHQPANDATVKKVRKSLNGYYWTFYNTVGTAVMKYEIEFKKTNKFEVRTSLLKNSGTYEVLNGYIVLNYKTGGNALEVPYDYKDGKLNLYLSEAFSIYE